MTDLHYLPEASYKILLVDDQALFRAGLASLLNSWGPRVSTVEADTVDAAAKAFRAGGIDLVLADIYLDGSDVSRDIVNLHDKAPESLVVFVSKCENVIKIREMIAAGAAGFIPKSSPPTVFLSALSLVLAGGTYLPPGLLNSGKHDDNTGRNGHMPMYPKLSKRQEDVLRELAKGKSNKQIAACLNMAEATVKVHISAIMRAFKTHNRTQTVILAERRGILPMSV
jgi:DNA-binding NarL/FixJ family response regulator